MVTIGLDIIESTRPLVVERLSRRRILGVSGQTEAANFIQRVVIADKNPHVPCHGARDNLSRHEKMPQIHLFGEFRSSNAGHFDRVDGALLRLGP
jgi:hypothetical protein